MVEGIVNVKSKALQQLESGNAHFRVERIDIAGYKQSYLHNVKSYPPLVYLLYLLIVAKVQILNELTTTNSKNHTICAIFYISVFIFQPLILSLFRLFGCASCWYIGRYASDRWRYAVATCHESVTKVSLSRVAR